MGLVSAVIAIAVCFFTLGVIHARRLDALDRSTYDKQFDALRVELQSAIARDPRGLGTAGVADSAGSASEASSGVAAERARMVADIKEQLRTEMGLVPLSLIRERRASFVELYTYDNHGQKNYGTAGYLGNGYFITVKHAVVALAGGDAESIAGRKITAVKIVYEGQEIPARIIDSGSAAHEVDPGDWAIIKTRGPDLPPLPVDTSFAYDFAEPIFRLGNDYSKGIILSTGYVGQRTPTGLVTSLTDGHPGVSGGGVLDQRGVLVGIPIGRMQGDYRFSFILPIRADMLRKVAAN